MHKNKYFQSYCTTPFNLGCCSFQKLWEQVLAPWEERWEALVCPRILILLFPSTTPALGTGLPNKRGHCPDLFSSWHHHVTKLWELEKNHLAPLLHFPFRKRDFRLALVSFTPGPVMATWRPQDLDARAALLVLSFSWLAWLCKRENIFCFFPVYNMQTISL